MANGSSSPFLRGPPSPLPRRGSPSPLSGSIFSTSRPLCPTACSNPSRPPRPSSRMLHPVTLRSSRSHSSPWHGSLFLTALCRRLGRAGLTLSIYLHESLLAGSAPGWRLGKWRGSRSPQLCIILSLNGKHDSLFLDCVLWLNTCFPSRRLASWCVLGSCAGMHPCER